MSDRFEQLQADLEGRYRLEREIGAGGMATVYLAHDVKHARKVALKAMLPELAAAIGAQRFLNEIRVTANLHHPHILQLYDSGEAAGSLFYVMPLVEGESLRDRLKRERQLPVADALRITREVADALSYAHAHGVVHRDVKPENILLQSGHAVVADFGIARAVSAAGGEQLTHTGMAVGTPAYMSPEQAAGDHGLDARSDIYSLGCVTYEMLAGEPPHTGPTTQAIIARRMTEDARPLSVVRDTVPSAVNVAVAKALARTPADRFATAREFKEALKATATPPIGATPTASPLRARPVGWALGIGTVIVAVALGAVAVRGPSPANTERPMLAVLPFQNLGSPDDEYFADGVTEETTSRLGSISGIGVVSRTSATRYKGTTKSLREIADDLGVQYVLDGTIRTDRLPDGSGRVRVTPQLIRVSDDTHLWTKGFTVSLAPGEIFEVQAEIAEEVAAALDVALLASERSAVQRQPTTDLEAHNAYLLGRFQWNKRTPDGLERAAEHFTTAITRDSGYARAYAGLADTYSLFPFYSVAAVSRSVAYARAEEAARRAIELDETLAEAHASLAFILTFGRWDWAGADVEFRRALALDPDYAVAHYWYAELLAITGRLRDAVAQAEQAVALEPAAPITRHVLGFVNLLMDRVDEAKRHALAALELEPEFPFPHLNLGIIAAQEGQWEEAERRITTAGIFGPIVKAAIHARQDSTTMVQGVETIERFKHHLPSSDPAWLGLFYGLMGAREQAVAALRAAQRERTEGLLTLIWYPALRELMADPRLQDMLREMNLAR